FNKSGPNGACLSCGLSHQGDFTAIGFYKPVREGHFNQILIIADGLIHPSPGSIPAFGAAAKDLLTPAVEYPKLCYLLEGQVHHLEAIVAPIPVGTKGSGNHQVLPIVDADLDRIKSPTSIGGKTGNNIVGRLLGRGDRIGAEWRRYRRGRNPVIGPGAGS